MCVFLERVGGAWGDRELLLARSAVGGENRLQIQREALCKKIITDEEINRRQREKHTQDGLYVAVLLF